MARSFKLALIWLVMALFMYLIGVTWLIQGHIGYGIMAMVCCVLYLLATWLVYYDEVTEYGLKYN